MNNEQVKALFATHALLDFNGSDQLFDKRLQLTLRDMETGEMSVLTVTACQLVLPDEVILDYEWREIRDTMAPSPEHFYELDTLGRDDKSNVPFLQGEQAGLF